MPIKQIKTSFNSGELSEYMAAREDINKYHNGASKMINATVLPHGGFVKRSGTEFIATAPGKSTLLPFEFSVDDSLVLELSEFLLRFYKNGAIVVEPVGTEDISALDNVVAHWLLNEVDGVNAADDDGGTHDGTISTDAANVTSAGLVNTGFDLDGQYDITVSDSNDFSFTDNSNDTPFSVVCWGKVTQKGGLQVLLSKWRNESTTKEWRLSLNNERKLQLHLADNSTGLDTTMIAQWKLNDNAANTLVDDVSTNHDGVCSVNTNTLTATGQINAALDFGGTESAEVPDDPAFSFGNGTTDDPFSIAAWVFFTSTGATQTIISKYDGTSGAEAREWSLHVSSFDLLAFFLYDESENVSIFNGLNDGLTNGWHFIVVTYDGSSNRSGIILYLDNVKTTVISGSNAYVAMENTTTTVKIGTREGGGGSNEFFWEDKLDNITMFDKELTTAEVSVLWNDGNGTETLASTVLSPFAVSDDAISNGWHFFGSTYSAPADETTAADGIILYVDGVEVDSTATNDINYTAMQNGAEEVRIGSQRNSGDSANELFWEDEIDEISIYSDVLTPVEVLSLYSTTPLLIVSPYTAAQAEEVHVTQSADVMYLAHGDHHPKKISRFGDLDWVIEDVPFTNGPFLFENTTDSSLIGFARTGGTARSGFYFPTGTIGSLTASGADNAPFNSDMVGALWLIKHRRPDNTKSTQDNDTNASPTDFTNAVRTKGDYTFDISKFVAGTDSAKLWRKEGDGAWQEFRTFTAATAFSSTENEDDTFYAFTFSVNTMKGTFTAKAQTNYGIVKITAFTSSTVVTVTVVDQVLSDNSTDNAVTTSLWAEGAWSNFRGYPRTVVFFEDRLWWASSTNNPDTLWSSQSGIYENMGFTDLGLDNEAITFPINDNEVSQIQWMQSRQVMAVGAANKEYRFGASDPDKPVTPSDRKATPQTSEGSHTIQPVILKDSIFFFQSLGRKLGKMKFDALTENFDVEDATMLAYRLFDSSPVDIAVQRVPDSIIWTVRADGVAPTLTYEPKEDVLGWSRQIFGNTEDVETPTGFVESFAVIHGSIEDEVWASVKWTINSSVVRHIVKFKPRDFGSDVEDAFYVDSGITYDSTSTTTITGLGHLVGENVAVFADGLVQTEKNVLSTPIAHWKLNDNAANTIVEDSSSNANNGVSNVNTDTAGYSVVGKINECLDMGGTRFITVPDQSYYSFGDGATDRPFSISVWVYVTEHDTWQTILSKASTFNVGEWTLYIQVDETVVFSLMDSGNDRITLSNSPVTLNEWNHIVVTYDGSGANTGLNMYIDNVLNNNRTSSGVYNGMTAGALDVLIGAETGGTKLFQNKIDDVRIYNKVLSTAEINSLYASGDGTEITGDGDSIILDTAASVVQVGLPYTMKVRTMRHSIPQDGTTIQTRIKRIERTNVRYIRSLLGTAGQEYDGVEYLQPIDATFSTEAKDTKPDNRLAQGGFSEDAYTTIISDDPVPFTGLASIIDIEVEK